MGSILDLEGLGKEVWAGVDPKEYVGELRKEWNMKRESEFTQEEIAKELFLTALPMAALFDPEVTRDWHALHEKIREIYRLQAQWIINYGLDCRNAEKEEFLRKLE